MKEYSWQFRVYDVSSLSDRGVAFFAIKASEMARMLGFILVETKNVEMEQWHNNVMIVSGVAVLCD
jgi:hypothetical protein